MHLDNHELKQLRLNNIKVDMVSVGCFNMFTVHLDVHMAPYHNYVAYK